MIKGKETFQKVLKFSPRIYSQPCLKRLSFNSIKNILQKHMNHPRVAKSIYYSYWTSLSFKSLQKFSSNSNYTNQISKKQIQSSLKENKNEALKISVDKLKQIQLKQKKQIDQVSQAAQTKNQPQNSKLSDNNAKFEDLKKMIVKAALGTISAITVSLLVHYLVLTKQKSFQHLSQIKQAQKKSKQAIIVKKYSNKEQIILNKDIIFNDYQVYKKIQNIFDNWINKNGEILGMHVITGPSGIGKSTCIKLKIINCPEIIEKSKKRNRIFYINLKQENQQNADGEVNTQKLKDLQKILAPILTNQSQRQKYNNLLIIDQINVVCKQKYRFSLYYLRGLVQKSVKIIALSSCSQATQFLNSVIPGFLYKHNLQTLKPNEIKNFLKFKLNPKLGDNIISQKTLDTISLKFKTIRDLNKNIQIFNCQNTDNKQLINQKALQFFSPILEDVNGCVKKIDKIAQDITLITQLKFQLSSLAYKFIVNTALNLLTKEMQRDGEKPKKFDQHLKIQETMIKWQQQIQNQFKRRLYQQNVIFGNQQFTKSQNARLALVKWVQKQQKKIKGHFKKEITDKWNELMPWINKFYKSEKFK